MKYSAYENRNKKDVYFMPEMGEAVYQGQLSDLVHWVEKDQLLDPALWALFVEQFRIGNIDDHDSGWRGEYWGKMMRGACFTYAYTQNEQLYHILESTVRDILTTQDSFGRISTYSVTEEFRGWDMWGRKYVLLGLQYFLEICRDDALEDRILEAMCRHADYILKKIGNDVIGKIPVTNTSEGWGGLNSSSILEPMVRMYDLTGQQKYLDFAKEIIDAGGTKDFDIFEAALEGKKYPYEYPHPKAYEMISNFEGIVEYYRATGEEKYRTMAINFARLLMDSDITVIGCAGTSEEIFDHSKIHQFDPNYKHIMQETCVTVTWMKFCYQLLCLTGEAQYADQIEKSVYNALLGAVNVNGRRCQLQGGTNGCYQQTFTFDSYSPLLNNTRGREVGGQKDIIQNRFWWGCCVAIGSAGTGLIGMVSNMKAADGLVVNFYQKGEYKQTLSDGNTIGLHMDTEYPVDGRVQITVSPEQEEDFALYIRIPSWSRKTSAKVNGEILQVNPGSYARVERIWKKGDVVELIFDMGIRVIHATDLDPEARPEAACHVALQRGPLMLARDSRLGENVASAVSLLESDGCVNGEASNTAAFDRKVEYRIRTEEGFITVADYASCGQGWEADMPVTVWITTKTRR